MKKGAVLLPLLLLIIFVACRGVSATQVERDLYANLDKGDVAGALALTTEDAVFDIPGCPQGGCKGKDAIKSAFEGAVAQHTRHTIKSSKDSKNTATSQVEDELDLAKAAGVQRVVLKVDLEVKGGKIVRYRAQFDTSDPQTATVVNFRRLRGIYRQNLDASNRGDIPTVMANYTDDAEFRGRPTCHPDPCVGKAAIQKRFEDRVAGHSQVTTTDIQVSGDTLTTRTEVRSDSTRAAGVERIVNKGTVTFKGDKIVRHVVEADRSDPQTVTFANFGRLSGILRQHIDAINRDDVAGGLATLTDDAEYVRGLRCLAETPCKGKDAIKRDALEADVRFKNRYTIVKLEVSGDTVTARTEFRGQGTRDAGIERGIATHTVTFRGDKISRYITEPDLSDPQTAAADNFRRVARLVVRQIDAFHRGDVAGVMALFTDDAVYEGLGLCASASCTGKVAVQKEIEQQVADKTKVTGVLGTFRVSGNTATIRVEIQSDSIKAAGVERIVASLTREVKDSKVSLYRIEPDRTDAQTATFFNFQRVMGLHQRFIEAVARGDVEGALALFADDAVIEGRGVCARAPCRGKADIRKEIERVVNERGGATLTNVPVSGDTTTARIEIRNDSARAAGVERLVGTQSLDARGDKIAAIRFKIDTSDPQTATYLNFTRLSRLLRQLYDVGNRGDVATTASFFTDDATLVRGGCSTQAPCVGTAAIQRQLEREPTLQFRYSVINVQVSGDTATGRVEFRNINIKNAGQERVIENVTATFKGDKISRLAHALDLSDSQTAAFANFRRMAGINSRYTDAISIGSVAGAMAALTEDAVVGGYGLCAAAPCAGKAAIQKEVERQVADKTKIATVGGTARVTGDTWTGRVEVRSDSIKAAGVERIIVAATVGAKGDKVSLIRWVPDSTDPQTATYLKSQAK